MLVIGALGSGAAAAVLFAFDPARVGFFPSCPWYALTGWHCAGCGTMRACHQLLHGRLGAAFALNPLTVLTLPLIGYAGLVEAREWLGWRPWPRPLRSTWSAWAVFVVLVAYSVLRNVPIAPFSWLAPS